MNKLLQKLAKIFLGLSMAAGVGVAIGAGKTGASQVSAATKTLSASGLGSSTSITDSQGNSWTSNGGTGSYLNLASSKYVRSNGAITDVDTSSGVTVTANAGTYGNGTFRLSFRAFSDSGFSSGITDEQTITPTTKGNAQYSFNDGSAIPFTSTASNIYFKYWASNTGAIRFYAFSVTYTAKSTGTTYTVTYNANGATSGSVPTDGTAYSSGVTVTVKDNTGSLAKTDYVFGGWNTQADGNGTNYTAGSGTFTITQNTTLYAKWNEPSSGWVVDTSNFDTVGSGTGYTPYNGSHTLDGINYTTNQVMIQSSKIQFQKNNSYFYNTTSFGKIKKITLGSPSGLNIRVHTSAFTGRNTSTGTATTSGSNVTGTNGYFLIYDSSATGTCTSITVESEEATYTVSFAVSPAGSGTLSQSQITGVPKNAPITTSSNTVSINGTTVTATAASTTDQYTYAFSTWTKSPNNSTVTSDMTITAVFSTTTNTYTVTWKDWDNSTLRVDNNVEYGTTPSYGSTPTRSPSEQYTYTFTGWSPNPGAITGNTTYTAQYSQTLKTFTVSESIEYGDLDDKTSIQYGGDLDVNIEPDDGYTYPDSITVTMGEVDITEDVEYENGNIKYSPVTGNIVVTGSCEQVAEFFDVNYDANEGTVAPTSESVIENGHPSFPTPTRSGYNFKGWQVEGSGTAYTDPNAYTVTTDVNFVAKWVAVYTVSFNANGGSSTPESLSVEDGSTFTFPSAPGTKTHYSFDGWTSTGDEPYHAAGATSPAVKGNITYTAHWTEDAKYSVTYVCGEHGTGDSYIVSNIYGGSSHSLVSFATAGFTASSGYKFKCWSVGGNQKDPEESITVNAATTVTAIYEEIHEYTLVTDVTKLVEGTEFILVSRGQYPANTGTIYTIAAGAFSYASSKGQFSQTSVSLTNDLNSGSIATSAGATIFTLSGDSSGWTIGEKDGDKILGFTGTDNRYMNFTSEMTDTFTITAGDSNAVCIDSKTQSNRSIKMTLNGQNSTINPYFSNYRSDLNNPVYMFAYIPPQNELSSITLSGDYKTSFASGDSFSFGGVVTANYTINDPSPVTGSVTFHLDSADGTSMSGVTMTHAAHDGHTIYAKYTEGGITKTATYGISVANAPVSSVSITTHAAEIGLGEEYVVSGITPTVLPADAVQTTEWVVSANTVNGDYTWNGTKLTAGSTEGSVTLRCRSTVDNSKFDDLVISIVGDPTAAFSKDSTSGYVGKSETISFTFGNFDAEDVTIASGNTSYVTIGAISASEGTGTVVINFVGAGSTSVTISDGSSTLDTLTVSVSADSVVSVTWSASNIDVFSGATLSTDGWNVQYEMASHDSGTASSYTIKLGSETVSAGYTFKATDNGKTMHVEYGGVSSSTITVTVTQRINSVNTPISSDSWDYTFESKQFSQNNGETPVTLEGKQWVASGNGGYWGYDSDKGQQFGSGSSPNTSLTLSSSSFSGTITSVTVYTSGAKSIVGTVQVSVGGTAYGDAETLTDSNSEYVFDLGGKSGDIVITYSQTSSKAIYIKEIVVETTVPSSDIANSESHKAAQRAAVGFANAFNAAMDETENCTTGLDAAWATCSSAYTSFCTAAAALGETEEAYAKNLVKYATVQYSDDSGEACIERMMKTYEVMVQKHGKTAFMSDLVSLGGPQVSPLVNIIGENTNTVAIIVIISMVSVTAIGGYFFLRKRKEE